MRNAVLIAVCVAFALAAWLLWLPAHKAPSPSPPPPVAEVPEPRVPWLPERREPEPEPGAEAPPDAADLTERARAVLERDPAAALEAIERADALAGERDEMRRVLEIEAFVRLGRVGHARALTDRFFRQFPGSAEIPRLERLTGYHPRPHGP